MKWSTVTDDTLMLSIFIEGVPEEEMYTGKEPIVVHLSSDKTKMPFGNVDTAPFLELLWRKTGADCSGEEEDLILPFGTYRILLKD
jgi:hypothetical protein